MSKADTLLKRAASFERMALYADRKSFLQAIAQEQDPNRQLIWQALQLLQQAGVDESLTAPLGNAITFGKVDLAAIKQAIQSIILTGKLSPLSQQPVINQLKTLMSQMKTPQQTETDQAMQQPGMQMPADHIRAFPPVDRKLQEALSRVTTIDGLGIPLDVDGQLGPKTKAALSAFKKKYGPSMTDQQALQKAQQLVQSDPKYKS